MRTLIVTFLLISGLAGDLFAAHFREGGWLSENGVLEAIRLEPRLPKMGDGFIVRLAGSWPEKNPDGFCFAAPAIDDVVVYEGNRVQVISNLEHDPDLCGQPPVSWNLEAQIPAGAWDAVDAEGFLLVEHLMYSGINMLTGINQVFDLRLGTHEIPAYLGSGFWISVERPYEGLMIEQQGSRVLFYSFGYDRVVSRGDSGEPVWLMFTGDMMGGSALARAYRFDWPVDDGLSPGEIPAFDALHTANDSGAIIVDDYNHIQALTELSNNRALYQEYKRYAFGLDPGRLPVFVPPLAGSWTVYGFEHQTPMFQLDLELLEGYSTAANRYHFDSVNGDWQALCVVVPAGTGDCRLEHLAEGTRFDFPLSAFQGNLARGALHLENGSELDGVFVRNPWIPAVLESSAQERQIQAQ